MRYCWIPGSLLVIVLAGLIVLPQVIPSQLNYQLALVDREGKRTPIGVLPLATFAPRISPDGRQIVFDRFDDNQAWIADFANVAAQRPLSTSGRGRGPLWTGDSKRVLYIDIDQGEEALFWRAADRSDMPERLVRPARAPESWSPQHNAVSFITLSNNGDYDVWTYSFKDKRATPFVVVPGSAQHSSHFSPDGRWVAYASAESGRLEVYVRPFPAGTPVVRVTQDGGEHPLWSPDQKELYFDTANQLYAVPITTGATFTAGTHVKLPITGYIQGPLRRQYDLMPDGKRFLMMFPQ